MSSESRCPIMGGSRAHKATGTVANQHWWPDQLNLKILSQNSELTDPMGEDFDYAEEFAKVDLDQLAREVDEVMTTSQEWWPGRLRALRSALHPHGVAQRRHLAHSRRPWWGLLRHDGRSRLRLELAAPSARRSLRRGRRRAEVRGRLRGGVGQGHDPRPVRSRVGLRGAGGSAPEAIRERRSGENGISR